MSPEGGYPVLDLNTCKARNIIISWDSSAHNQSGRGRQDTCFTNVCLSSKTSKDAFLYKAECSIPIRSTLVAHFPVVLERAEHSASSSPLNIPRLHRPDRCLGIMGMYSTPRLPMATVAMAPRMGK